jgi:tetraacyldisaccharide 4'-kinase
VTPKVISVGNISLGGTGKTPFTIRLTNYFLAQGKKVCVLSRGYKGKIGLGTNVISDGENILIKPPLAADEPYMIAENCKGAIVITGRERADSAAYAMEHFKPDLFILDDGFQHKRMHRDLDILLLDYRKPISTGLPFPFGYLREFPKGIRRADIIVFTRADNNEVPSNVVPLVKDKPVFFSNIEFKGIRTADGQLLSSEDMMGKKCLGFSGIAGGGRFFAFLYENGINVVKNRQFPDHMHYCCKTLDRLEDIVEHYKLDMIVTTQKDFVKISEDRRHKYAYAEIDIALNDEEGFFGEITKKLF